jgi:hypothetical protein
MNPTQRTTRNSQRAGYVADNIINFGRRTAVPVEVHPLSPELPDTPDTPVMPFHNSFPATPLRRPSQVDIPISPLRRPTPINILAANQAHGDNNPFVDRSPEPLRNEEQPVREAPTTRHSLPVSPFSDEIVNGAFAANQERLTDVLAALSQQFSNQSGQPQPQLQQPAAPRAKPRAPDVFDGTDPSKVNIFIMQCAMYITLRAADFPDETAKVSFMMTYLKGSPLDWFQTSLSQAMSNYSTIPTWFTSVAAFTEELKTLFGPHDPVTDATIALENLRYRDSGKAVKYSLDFNRHALKTGWNEVALLRQYYKGLPDRLKDEIARLGKPATLSGMQQTVQTLDQRYWERQSEINRDKRQTATQQAAATKSTTPAKTWTPAAKSTTDNQSKPSGSTPSNAPKSKKPHSDKLGSDGKLTVAERNRRFAEDLCLGCGKEGHRVRDCRTIKQPSRPAAKGKASTVEAASADSDKSEQPKE